MKYLTLVLIPIAIFTTACRTEVPIDPMTMKPGCRCMPGQVMVNGVCSGTTVTNTK